MDFLTAQQQGREIPLLLNCYIYVVDGTIYWFGWSSGRGWVLLHEIPYSRAALLNLRPLKSFSREQYDETVVQTLNHLQRNRHYKRLEIRYNIALKAFCYEFPETVLHPWAVIVSEVSLLNTHSNKATVSLLNIYNNKATDEKWEQIVAKIEEAINAIFPEA